MKEEKRQAVFEDSVLVEVRVENLKYVYVKKLKYGNVEKLKYGNVEILK